MRVGGSEMVVEWCLDGASNESSVLSTDDQRRYVIRFL